MSLKRKKSNRLVEGDVDAERLVSFRTFREVNRSGRTVVRKVKENLQDPGTENPATGSNTNFSTSDESVLGEGMDMDNAAMMIEPPILNARVRRPTMVRLFMLLLNWNSFFQR